MRDLSEPRVLSFAALAAGVSVLTAFPRLALWNPPRFPLWYLLLTLGVSAFVLWAFVFAWTEKQTHRPIFIPAMASRLWAGATLAGIAGGATLNWLSDSRMRAAMPEDFPRSATEWMAATLFLIGFNQLFFVFAPFALFARLFRKVAIAGTLTVIFGVGVIAYRIGTTSPPPSADVLGEVLVVRAAGGAVSLWFYLRGGVWLASWWQLLLQARHLVQF